MQEPAEVAGLAFFSPSKFDVGVDSRRHGRAAAACGRFEILWRPLIWPIKSAAEGQLRHFANGNGLLYVWQPALRLSILPGYEVGWPYDVLWSLLEKLASWIRSIHVRGRSHETLIKARDGEAVESACLSATLSSVHGTDDE